MTYLPQQHTHTFELSQKILEILKDEHFVIGRDALTIAGTLLDQRDPDAPQPNYYTALEMVVGSTNLAAVEESPARDQSGC